jgi:hypothetical protein
MKSKTITDKNHEHARGLSPLLLAKAAEKAH